MANLDSISFETYESQKCHIRYGNNSLEIKMWFLL